jgi:superfamily II DNA or RNA helicase
MEVLSREGLSRERENELRSAGATLDASGRWLRVPEGTPDASERNAIQLEASDFHTRAYVPEDAVDQVAEALEDSRWRSTDDPHVYQAGVYRLSRGHAALQETGVPVDWRTGDREDAEEVELRHYQERAGGDVMVLLERYDPDHWLVERIVDNAQQTWYREDGLLMVGPPAYNKTIAELASRGATCVYDADLVEQAEGEGVDTDTDVKLRVAKDMVANPCRFRIIEGSMTMAKGLADRLNEVGDREEDQWLVPREEAVPLVENLRERGIEMVTRRLDGRRSDYEHWRPNLPMDRGPGRPEDRDPVEDLTLEDPVPDLQPHTVLDDHQRRGAAYIRARDYKCVVGDEMGLGKTLTSLAAAQYLDGPVLVVCPSNARPVWPREIDKWIEADDRVLSPGDDVEQAFSELESEDRPDYTIVSYDGMDRFYDVIDAIDWDLVVIDEAHYLRNRRTKRVQLARELLLDIPRRVLLTGTPLMNDPSELRSLLYFVHPDEWEDASWFRRRFKKPWERGTPEVREQVVERLHEYLDDVMIRRVKSDIFRHLPDKSTHVHHVDLTPGWRREYREEEQQYAEEHEASSDALGSLQRLNRLRQLAVNGKLEDVIPHIRRLLDQGEKVVVFGFFLSGLRTLQEAFDEHGSTMLTGSSSDNQRKEAVQSFQSDSDCRLFLGQINAAGQAITLTAARHVVFLDLVWNPSVMRQAMDRVHRRGQEDDVHVHFFVTEDTIEEDIRVVLEEKARLVDAVVDDAAFRDMDAVHWEVTERLLDRQGEGGADARSGS